MVVVIECDEFIDVLSRTLDLIRRMGLEMRSVRADGATVELSVTDPAGSELSTLRERITLIGGVRSVSVQFGSDPSSRDCAPYSVAGASARRRRAPR
jgi:hypothetical protein